jgi:hypothetical protein
MRKMLIERNGVPYKLEIGKMISAFLSESFRIMVLPLRQEIDLGLLHPDLYPQPHYLAPDSH